MPIWEGGCSSSGTGRPVPELDDQFRNWNGVKMGSNKYKDDHMKYCSNDVAIFVCDCTSSMSTMHPKWKDQNFISSHNITPDYFCMNLQNRLYVFNPKNSICVVPNGKIGDSDFSKDAILRLSVCIVSYK